MVMSIGLVVAGFAAEPKVIDLWPEGVPGLKPNAGPEKDDGAGRYTNIHHPTLSVFAPEKPIGTAVIYAPGGGYVRVAAGVNGGEVTKWLNSIGVTVFMLKYRNAEYGFTFSLPASWQGYSVLAEQWEGKTHLASVDTEVVTERGPVIVIRHPQWKDSDHYQDIPIRVFTRAQWEVSRQGSLGIDAGGVNSEIDSNSNYVFAVGSRFNADDTVNGWKEAGEIVERNRAANIAHLDLDAP